MKKLNPYTRLKNEFTEFCERVFCRRRVRMWIYPRKTLSDGWDLRALYERIQAAQQLGYVVTLNATEEGIVVTYEEKLPPRPWGI